MSASMIAPGPMPPKLVKDLSRPRLKRSRLRQTSERLRLRLIEYAKVKVLWWEARIMIDGGRCQFIEDDGSRCPKQASRSPHHIYGRGKYLNDPSTYAALCLPGHHSWPHEHPNEAREKGLLK